MRRLILLALLALPGLGRADTRMHLTFSVFGRSVPNLDLAEQAGVSGFGRADDAAALSLGVEVDFGIELDPIEIGISVAEAAGGLDQDAIEERYFDDSDTAQGASTSEAGLHAWWVFGAGEDLQWLAGPHARFLRMKGVSGAASARSDSLGFGAQFGMRFRTHKVSEGLDGSVRALVSLDANLPLEATVRRASGDPLFTNDSPDGVFYAYAVTAGFCLTFK